MLAFALVLVAGVLLSSTTGALASPPAETAGQWVLGPGSEGRLETLARVVAEAAGVRPGHVSVEGGRVRFQLRRPGGAATLEAVLGHERTAIAPPLRALPTSAGVFGLPPGVPVERDTAIKAAVDASGIVLPWRHVRPNPDRSRTAWMEKAAPPDEARRSRVLGWRRRALAVRRGSPVTAPGPAPVRAPTHLSGHALASGQISAWLASGGLDRLPDCRGPCLDRRIAELLRPSHHSTRGSIEGLIREHPLEPKLWVLGALAALHEGATAEALAMADVATRFSRPDADALLLWARLTGASVHLPEDALAGVLVRRDPAIPAWIPLALAAGGALWLLAAFFVAGGRRRLALAAVAAGFLAGLFGWLSLQPSLPLGPPPRDLPDPLIAPMAGSACRAAPGYRTPRGLVYKALCRLSASASGEEAPSDPARKPQIYEFIVQRDTGRSPVTTGTHQILVGGRGQGVESDTAAVHLLRAVQAAEKQGWRVSPRAPEASTSAPLAERLRDAQRSEISAGAALAAAALICLLLLHLAFSRSLWLAAREDRVFGIGLGVALAVVLLLHLFAPSRLVLIYTGYDTVDELGNVLKLPRYGAGVVWLYRPFLQSLGVELASMQVANRVFGLLAFLPVAAACRAFVPRPRWALLGIAVFALSPIVLRDHVSESVIAGTSWLLLSGLAALLMVLVRGASPRLLVYAAPVLGWAAMCRPEAMVALAVLAPFALAAALRRREERPEVLWILLAIGGALLAALLPHATWLVEETRRQVEGTGVKPFGEFLSTLPAMWMDRNLFVRGPWLSPALLGWAAVALVAARGSRIWTAGFLAAGVAWIAVTTIDLPDMSVPRVQLPVLLMLLPTLGAGAAALQPRAWWANLAVAGLVAWAAAVSLGPSFRLGNAEQEDRLIEVARLAMPAEGGCLATVSYGDPPPPKKTQRHFPRYLFERNRVVGLDRLYSEWKECGGEAIVILGTRCYMRMRHHGERPPPGPGLLEVCARLRERFDLEPIVERDIPNITENTFPLYPDAETLRVGVYRVLRLRAGPKARGIGTAPGLR